MAEAGDRLVVFEARGVREHRCLGGRPGRGHLWLRGRLHPLRIIHGRHVEEGPPAVPPFH